MLNSDRKMISRESDSTGSWPLIVIGSVYVERRWILMDLANERLGRSLEDTIGGIGAAVAANCRVRNKNHVRLIAALGRDALAGKVQQWCQRLAIDLFAGVVAAPTGQRCLIKVADQWEMIVAEPGANPLLSSLSVETMLQEHQGTIFVSMDVGGHLVEQVLKDRLKRRIYVSGGRHRLSDYHLLSRAHLVLLNREQLGQLWGKPVIHQKDAESAIKALSHLGISRMGIYLGPTDAVVCEKNQIDWISQDHSPGKWEPVPLPFFELFVGAVISALEYGFDLIDAMQIGMELQIQESGMHSSSDEARLFHLTSLD